MKPNELMIGDWVCYSKANKYYTRVNEIRHTEVSLDDQWYIEGMRNDNDKINPNAVEYFAVEILSPIPLTPEILEKNGFVKYNEVSDTPPYDKDEEGNMYYSYKGEHKFWGWWQPNNVYFIPVNTMIDLEIKYVHQLQHALRLCGIDKEIEL